MFANPQEAIQQVISRAGGVKKARSALVERAGAHIDQTRQVIDIVYREMDEAQSVIDKILWKER